MYVQERPSPGHTPHIWSYLTRGLKLFTWSYLTPLIVGSLTQNFARQVGHLTMGETLDSSLKLKDFVPIQYESATNKIFDSTSVFATESFCLSFIETETFKCGERVLSVEKESFLLMCYQ